MTRKRTLMESADPKLRGVFITKDRDPVVRKREKERYEARKATVHGNSQVPVQDAAQFKQAGKKLLQFFAKLLEQWQ